MGTLEEIIDAAEDPYVLASGSAGKTTAKKVSGELIEQIKAGVAPWQKPWKPGERCTPEKLLDRQELHGRQQPLPDEPGHPPGLR